MQIRCSRGSTARLFLDLIADGEGLISESPTVALMRQFDDMWFQASDGSWQSTIVQNPMDESDSVNLPGRYQFDFDQSLDLEESSAEYIVRLTNTGAHATLHYDELVFGPLAGATAPELCSVQGTVFTPRGMPVEGCAVHATMQPVFKDAMARTVESGRVISTFTNGQGDFDIPLVRGGIFRLEIQAIGFDRKITVPDQASVLFTDL